MADKDLYRILGVSRSASAADIKKNYRNLARELHPDRNPDPTAEARFKEVSAAFAVLGDEKKRSIYDEFGPDGLRDGFDADAARSYQQFAGRFGGMGGLGGGLGGFGDLDDLLGGLFGGGLGGGLGGFNRQPRRKGQNIEQRVTISLRQAVDGAEIRLPEAQVTVKIPPGVANGQKIRLAGKGAQGVGGAGDLLLRVDIAVPPGCTRDDDNLTLDLPISVLQAIVGTSVDLPLPDGTSIRLNIPAGTQSGRRLRVRSRGLTTKAGRGHLYVRILIHVPDGDNEELRNLAEAMEAFYPSEGNSTSEPETA